MNLKPVNSHHLVIVRVENPEVICARDLITLGNVKNVLIGLLLLRGHTNLWGPRKKPFQAHQLIMEPIVGVLEFIKH